MRGRLRCFAAVFTVICSFAGELHTAVRAGDALKVKALLAAGASAGERDSLGGTALHDAAWSGDTALMEILIRAGAPVDAVHTETASTPLHYAAITNHSDAV